MGLEVGMSKERELLERLLKNFEQPVAGRFGDLFDEVRDYLAEPEVDRDPLSLTEKGTQYPYANEVASVSRKIITGSLEEKNNG
jgi:hypothetical protein